VTPTFTSSPTLTVTPTATPIVALVNAGEGGGAHLREEPGFQAPSITLLQNGTPVQVMPDDPVQEGGGIWIRVRTIQGEEGWILQILLVTATPAPTWEG
jgi:SH3-like domain-containing protein